MLPNNTVIKYVMHSLRTNGDVVSVLPEETETHDRVIEVLHRAVAGKTYAFITPVPVQGKG